jgi:class 3 adenylate cyclase/tetratricopeptide (TPR) repeat protein
MARVGRSNGAQDLNDVTPSMHGARLADDWVLTLGLVGPSRLLAALSDGLWSCIVGEGAWPPSTPLALPESVVQALGRLEGSRLRLQLPSALDAWPWERELSLVTASGWPVPRYLTDLPEAARPAQPPTGLVAPGAKGEAHFVLVQAAHHQRRPLVVADPALPPGERRALERSLRSNWRYPLLLSEALAQTLAQLGLPQACCRLYGDGRPQIADVEQGWRPVTALSIDLVSSTMLLQSLGAEAYARRLQAYHERCRDVILRFHGSLDVPQGDDGLMAYFGFPTAVEDAAARALTAAWQICSGMASLGLQVRIGAASGQVAVSAQQAFGPEVHLAARLCAAARPGQVLVAPSTRDRVGQGFVLDPCGESLALKDFGGLKGVHYLCGLRPAAAGNRNSPRPGGATRFVGRHRELDLLRDAWAVACGGCLQWCVLHGEAGIGKSRLLQEFSRELNRQGRRCVELTGQAHSGSSPFAAVVDALRQHWAIDADVDVAQLRQRLAGLLPSQHAEGDDLGELVRLLGPSHSDETPSTPRGQRRASELLLDCLKALIEPGPCCLLVDDAHWLDPSSFDLLRRLRDAYVGHALLVVLGERPESGRAMAFSSTAPVELQGLTEGEAGELATELGAALPEQVRQRIIKRAEGVPLYLEESLRMLSHRETEAGGDVPATLQDLLMVRLDELGSDRALAQLVSVLGREFSAIHLEAILEQHDPFIERARQQGSLGSLLDSGLLQALDGPLPGYRFKHALFRDAAYGSIWTDDRKRLHGLCADLIQRSTPALSRQRPELVAHHLQAAGLPAQARRAWLAAAQLSAARHAHQETVELAQHALALHEQVPDNADRSRSAMQLHLLLASAQIALRGYGSAEVEAAYQAAEQASSRLTDAAHTLRIRLGLEACYVMRGDLQRAAVLAQAGVAATDWVQDTRLALQARWALANVHFHQGDWWAALAGFDECLSHYQPELHRRSGVQDPAVMCLGYSSWIHFELGQADEALSRIARMLALAEELQHPFSAGVALGFAASIKRLCGDVDGAWPHALEAVHICERGGFQAWLAHAWMVRGQLRSDRGDASGGADDMDRGYALWVDGGARISCATYLVTRAELLLRQGQTERATADMSTAWQVSEQIGEHHYQAELLRVRGLCAWQAGEHTQAERTLRQALDLAERQRKPGLALRCMLPLGAWWVSQGQAQIAAKQLRPLLACVPKHGSSRDAHWARQALQCWDAGRAFESRTHTPWEPL